jgi:hypothetical protein
MPAHNMAGVLSDCAYLTSCTGEEDRGTLTKVVQSCSGRLLRLMGVADPHWQNLRLSSDSVSLGIVGKLAAPAQT